MSDAAPGPELEGVAQDAATIGEVMGAFEADGYGGQFVVREGGELECTACRTRTDAHAFESPTLRRLEGASDPDDMLAVAALMCPSCATRGTVVLGYGPSADLEDATVLAALEYSPSDSSTMETGDAS